MKVKLSPIVISPVPSVATGPISRPISRKRLGRLRLNWFMVGSLFGVGISFFMNFLVTSVVIPEYQEVMARQAGAQTPVPVAETTPKPEASPIVTAESNVEAATSDVAAANLNNTPATTPAPTAEITYPRTIDLEVHKGATLLDMLIENKVQVTEAHNVINALKPKFNPGKLKPGQKISVTLARHETIGDKAAVQELAINLPNLSIVELERLSNGGFNVKATKEELTASSFRGYGKVKSSLFQAGASAGIPSGAMNEIVKAFSYDVDFQRDIHPGDSIEVLMERKTSKDGRVGGYGDIRYAALTLQGEKKEIYRFKNAYGEYAWFDAKGNSIKKSLLRTPVDAVHITSGFGMRTHPLLGYTKFHRGVDFGAPTGTPIMAAGDGTVEFKGWKSGYGNFVVLRHNSTYETAYGHISRFANIKVGGRVKQGQVIAYVGMTGMATGPHLHYEVRQNDQQVNPVAKQFNMASGLTGKALTAFKANKAAVAKELASLANTNAVASR